MNASKERLRLWLRLMKLTRHIETDLRERFRTEFGSTLPRFDVMAALSQHEAGLRMSQLSAALRVSGGNVTVIADRLEQEGLVMRVAVPGDRRAMIVRLTAAGKAEFDRQAKAHEAWVNTLLVDVPAAEARDLAQNLAGLVQDKHLDHAS